MLVLAAVLGLGACTGAGGEVADPAESESTSRDRITDPSVIDPTPVTTGPAVSSAAPTSALPADPTTVAPIVEVPETGVPGLDSDDAFCAAWSRFGGSWQVLLVGSTFLGEPERVATWEIAAAPVIEIAYGELIDTLPESLASEVDLVADGYFGVLGRRSADALDELRAAGSSPDDERRLAAAWRAALARRDPTDPGLDFVVPQDLRPLVDTAVAEFRRQRVEFHLDPSMAVGVETPLTDAYLETTCPDQGTLTGQEVDDD